MSHVYDIDEDFALGMDPPTYLGAPTTNFEVDTSGSWEIFGYLGGPHLGVCVWGGGGHNHILVSGGGAALFAKNKFLFKIISKVYYMVL